MIRKTIIVLSTLAAVGVLGLRVFVADSQAEFWVVSEIIEPPAMGSLWHFGCDPPTLPAFSGTCGIIYSVRTSGREPIDYGDNFQGVHREILTLGTYKVEMPAVTGDSAQREIWRAWVFRAPWVAVFFLFACYPAWTTIVPPLRRSWRRRKGRWVGFVTKRRETLLVMLGCLVGSAGGLGVMTVARALVGVMTTGTFSPDPASTAVQVATERLAEFFVPIIGAVLGVLVAQRRAVPACRRRNGQCVRCGYNLTGNVSGVCPECGTPIDG